MTTTTIATTMPDAAPAPNMDAQSNGKAEGSAGQRMTSEERHYLLKTLVCMQMAHEWGLLEQPGILARFGPPFVDRDTANSETDSGGEGGKDGDGDGDGGDDTEARPVILRHMFQVHLRRFPGLDTAPRSYWRSVIAPLFDFLATDAGFSSTVERGQYTNRRLIALVVTRYLATYFARGVGVRGAGETRGPGKVKGDEAHPWRGAGKQWGKGTVKRGLDHPVRPTKQENAAVQGLFFDSGGGQREKEEAELWALGLDHVEAIQRDWCAWKESIIESEDGLDETLKLLETKHLDNLPPRFRNAAEWVRQHVAFVLWTVFTTYAGRDEIFSILKTVHGLFPYWGARQLLKIANAQKMIKAIIDLVLARPLGYVDSLGQRICFVVLDAQIASIERGLLKPLRAAIADEGLCRAVEMYAAERTAEDRARIERLAGDKHVDVLASVLLHYRPSQSSSKGSSSAPSVDAKRVREMHEAYAASPQLRANIDQAYPATCAQATEKRSAAKSKSKPSSSSASASSSLRRDVPPEALRFARLKLLLRDALRKRDRQKVLDLLRGPRIPTVLKTTLEQVFYKLIYDIALVSDLSSRLLDVQNFLDDLIRTKAAGKDAMEDWVALCARHEQSLYVFVHEVRDAVQPIFDWCQTCLDFMALATTTPAKPQDKQAKRIEVDLDELMARAAAAAATAGDDDALQRLHSEIRQTTEYVRLQKVRTKIDWAGQAVRCVRPDSVSPTNPLRKRATADDDDDGALFGAEPSEALRATTRDVGGLFGRCVGRYARDDGTTVPGRGTEMAEVPWAYFDVPDPLGQHLGQPAAAAASAPASQRASTPDDGGGLLRYEPRQEGQVRPPSVLRTRLAVLPQFRRAMLACLPERYT